MNRRIALAVGGLSAALLMVGGAAFAAVASSASIPDSSGIIHGCYRPTANGSSAPLTVIDTALSGGRCPNNQKEVDWSQTGPQGPAGPQGPQGTTGPQGVPGTGATVASLATGDPNCAAGGASITDGKGNTAYACNGSSSSITAGPAGLNVLLIYSGVQPNSAEAFCPGNAYPYLLGGGGEAFDSSGNLAPDLGSYPVPSFQTNDEGALVGDLGWQVVAPSGGTAYATAICAK